MLVLLWQLSLSKENCQWGDCNSFTWGIIQNELYTCSEDKCLFVHEFLFICDYFCEKYDKKNLIEVLWVRTSISIILTSVTKLSW